jgi:hypothetical protein
MTIGTSVHRYIGTSIPLIAIGAVLRWAVTAHVSWINLQTSGIVLFVVGLLGLALSVASTFWPGSRARGDDRRVIGSPPELR